MTGISIVSRFAAYSNPLRARWRLGLPYHRPDLHTLWAQVSTLPALITGSPPTMRYLELLGPLNWDRFPEREIEYICPRQMGRPQALAQMANRHPANTMHATRAASLFQIGHGFSTRWRRSGEKPHARPECGLAGRRATVALTRTRPSCCLQTATASKATRMG